MKRCPSIAASSSDVSTNMKQGGADIAGGLIWKIIYLLADCVELSAIGIAIGIGTNVR